MTGVSITVFFSSPFSLREHGGFSRNLVGTCRYHNKFYFRTVGNKISHAQISVVRTTLANVRNLDEICNMFIDAGNELYTSG